MTTETSHPAQASNEAVENAASQARSLLAIKDPLDAVTTATERLAQAANSSASIFLMAFGAVLIAIAVITQIRFDTYQLSHLRTGEFIALLASGVLLLLIGGGVRMYLGAIETKAERDHAES